MLDKSAAAAAGVKAGDVIVAVDDLKVQTSPELQEAIARHRPGDVVHLKINRGGTEKTIAVTLNNRNGSAEMVKKGQKDILNTLGADFETLDEKKARTLDLDGGVQVNNLSAGKLRKYTGMREGFIIAKVDGQAVKNVEDLVRLLEKKKGGVLLEGVYEDIPGACYYALGL